MKNQRLRSECTWGDIEADGNHLVAFAGGGERWRLAARRFARQARETGWFSCVRILSPEGLAAVDSDFVERRRSLFSSSLPGFGLWSWKPYVLRSYLEAERLGAEVVTYVDVGCHFNVTVSSRLRWQEYEKRALDSGVVLMHMPGLAEREWTKPAVLDHFALSGDQQAAPQVMGGFIMLRNDQDSHQFVSLWEEHCLDCDATLLRAPETKQEAGPYLRSHRYDQSILSCLAKSMSIASIPDETYFGPDWGVAGEGFPIWAVRNRSGVRFSNNSRWMQAKRFIEYGKARITGRGY